MSILSQAAPPARKPVIMTIYGPPGAGKTTLAATMAPRPSFMIRTAGQDVPRDFPEDKAPADVGETDTADKLWEQLRALAQDEHPYRSVIIDTVGGLDGLFTQALLDKEPGRNINQVAGGYGAGPKVVAADHQRVRKAAERLRERGMTVIFLAHSDINRIEPPDSDAYTAYQLRLPSKSAAPYVDDVDLVGFLKLSTVLRGDGDAPKKAISSGERVLVTHMNPAAVSKNRLGIAEEIDIEPGKNPLAEFMRRKRPVAAPKTDEVQQEGEAK